MGKKIATSKKPRLAAAAAPEESGSSSTPQQPPGEGEDAAGDDVDQTGRLPDDLLLKIITLLPTADGCRTQILSTRWRPLWRSASLNYEVCVRTGTQARRAAAILRSHPGPTRRFSLSWEGRWSEAYPAVDDLLRQPVLDDLPVLELHYAPDFMRSYPHNPSPLFMFRFSRTLRVLSVSCEYSRIDFSMNEACSRVDFPQLEQLTLKHVSISESTLHALLSRCHVLQSLILHHNIGYRRLRVTSSTLRSLGVTTDHIKDSLQIQRWQAETRFEEVNVEHAPLLESLIPDDVKYDMKIRVIHAPKLRILGYLYSGDATKVFKGVELISPTNAIRTVKILALKTVPDVDVIVEFLRCFPCVEKMNLVDIGGQIENAQRDVSLECLYAHLKNIQLTPYTGNRSQVQLIRFFLSNARVLKSMTFAVSHEPDAKSVASQRKKLMMYNRASQDAEFYFKADRFWSFSHVSMKDIHNLTLDNSFRI